MNPARIAALLTAGALGCFEPLNVAQAQQANMSFFVTSVGLNGGDLGGLAGADKHCQDLAAAADRDATIQQFLSASPLANAHGRMILPDEVAQAILYLVSDAACMVTGTAIAIDGGKSLGVPPRL